MDLNKPINGWLTPIEGIVLTHLAEQCRSGCIVNIGCAWGRSVQYLCERASVPVYAIDLALTKELIEFRNEVTRKPILIEGDSKDNTVMDRVEEPIELLFIDGDHSVEGAMADFCNWIPKVQSGGYVVIHDVFHNQIETPCKCPEVILAIGRVLGDFRDFKKYERFEFMTTVWSRVDTMMILQVK